MASNASVLHALEALVSPVGLIKRTGVLFRTSGSPRVFITHAELGDLEHVLPPLSGDRRPAWEKGGLIGLGVGLDEESSRIRAIAEAIERHAACTFSTDQLLRATARELGDEALDLTRVACCSPQELAHAACPLVAPELDAPIRWVRARSLSSERRLWVPAVMVYLRYPTEPAERFHLPMSTGCAAHTELAPALINALTEVIERDSCALVWLERRSISELELGPLRRGAGGAALAELLALAPRLRCFDATTDAGVPVVYGVDVDEEDRVLATIAAAACDPDPARAVSKVAMDVVAYRPVLRMPRELPADPDLFDQGVHGASWIGAPERKSAFDFLLRQNDRSLRPIEQLPHLEAETPEQMLAQLVDRLARAGFEAWAVELTTREAARAGLRVVRVLVPDLMPITFRLRARYLGHRRLRGVAEEDVNPWPQPIA